MNNDTGTRFKELCNEAYEILNIIDGVNSPFLIFIEEWALEIPDTSCILLGALIKEYMERENKLADDDKKCVVFGETNAGKSTLINAILGEEILYSSRGRTTNCFVKISKSQNNESYLKCGNEIIMGIEAVKNYFRGLVNSNIDLKSDVDLFYEPYWLSTSNVTIVDTPGIDVFRLTDENIEKYCNNAILVLLVVDGTGTMNNKIKKFVKRFKTKFVRSHIFIVINKWDEMEKDEIERVELQHVNFATKIFCNQLNYSKNDARRRTFFISALRQLTSPNGDQNDDPFRQSFENFKNKLKTELSIGGRKLQYLEELSDVIDHTIKESKQMSEAIQTKMSEAIQTKISISGLSSVVEKKIESIKIALLAKFPETFKKLHKDFIDKFLKVVDQEITEDEIKNRSQQENVNNVNNNEQPEAKEDNDSNEKASSGKGNETNSFKGKTFDRILQFFRNLNLNKNYTELKKETQVESEMNEQRLGENEYNNDNECGQSASGYNNESFEFSEMNAEDDAGSISSTYYDASETTPLITFSVDVVNVSENNNGFNRKMKFKEIKKIIMEERIRKLITECIDEMVKVVQDAFAELVNDHFGVNLKSRCELTNLEHLSTTEKDNLLSYIPKLIEIFEMHKKYRKIKIIAGVSSAVLVGLTVATGGVLGAVIAPIEFTILSYVGIGAATGVGGMVVGGAGSVGVIEAFRMLFRNMKKKTKIVTKDVWETMENKITETFVEALESANFLNEIFIQLKEDLRSLEDRSAFLRANISSFGNSLREVEYE